MKKVMLLAVMLGLLSMPANAVHIKYNGKRIEVGMSEGDSYCTFHRAVAKKLGVPADDLHLFPSPETTENYDVNASMRDNRISWNTIVYARVVRGYRICR